MLGVGGSQHSCWPSLEALLPLLTSGGSGLSNSSLGCVILYLDPFYPCHVALPDSDLRGLTRGPKRTVYIYIERRQDRVFMHGVGRPRDVSTGAGWWRMLGSPLPKKPSLVGVWPWFRGSHGFRRKLWQLSWCQLGFWLWSDHGSPCSRRHLW